MSKANKDFLDAIREGVREGVRDAITRMGGDFFKTVKQGIRSAPPKTSERDKAIAAAYSAGGVTLEELGKRYGGLTRERIRQIVNRANGNGVSANKVKSPTAYRIRLDQRNKAIAEAYVTGGTTLDELGKRYGLSRQSIRQIANEVSGTSTADRKTRRDKSLADAYVGKRFGRLVVIRRAVQPHLSTGEVLWECRCDCGKDCVVTSNKLKTGHTHSCGCLVHDVNIRNGAARAHDLTGQGFGRLVVVRRAPGHGNNRVFWECHCDCGKDCIVRAGALRAGSTHSCGCLRREWAAGLAKHNAGESQ